MGLRIGTKATYVQKRLGHMLQNMITILIWIVNMIGGGGHMAIYWACKNLHFENNYMSSKFCEANGYMHREEYPFKANVPYIVL